MPNIYTGLQRPRPGVRANSSAAPGSRPPSLFFRLLASQPSRTVAGAVEARVAPERLHRVGSAVVPDHVERRTRHLQAIPYPRALVADLPTLVVEPGAVLNQPSGGLRAGISECLCDFMTEHDGDTIEIAGRRGIDEILAASAAGVEYVRHVDERHARSHARIRQRRREIVPGAVGVLVEAGLIELLRGGDHDLRIGQVCNTEVQRTTGAFLGELEWAQIVVYGTGVVVPDARELVRRIADIGIGAIVIALVLLGGDLAPGRSAHRRDKARHQCANTVGIARRVSGGCVIERARLAPAPEDEVELWLRLHVTAEIRHIDRHRLSGGNPGRADPCSHADIHARG